MDQEKIVRDELDELLDDVDPDMDLEIRSEIWEKIDHLAELTGFRAYKEACADMSESIIASATDHRLGFLAD